MKKLLMTTLMTIIIVVIWSSLVFGLETPEGPKVNWTKGPSVVDVGSNLAKLNLPKDYLFAKGEDAKKIMEFFDNSASGQEVGIVFPKENTKDWYILFEYDNLGFVKDDEADNLNADEILDSIKEGNDEANNERKDKGIPALEILGWDEKPHYDTKTHNLVWSILGQSEGEKVVNYNTRILGRFGITSVTLVADPKELVAIKPELNKILNNYSYVEGKKYINYVPGQDKVAEVGLAALVAGGAGAAAAKLGLLAKILLLFKKAWIIILSPFIYVYKKLKNKFTGENQESTEDVAIPIEQVAATENTEE